MWPNGSSPGKAYPMGLLRAQAHTSKGMHVHGGAGLDCTNFKKAGSIGLPRPHVRALLYFPPFPAWRTACLFLDL